MEFNLYIFFLWMERGCVGSFFEDLKGRAFVGLILNFFKPKKLFIFQKNHIFYKINFLIFQSFKNFKNLF